MAYKTWNSIDVGTTFRSGARIIKFVGQNDLYSLPESWLAVCPCGVEFLVIEDPANEGLQLCPDCLSKRRKLWEIEWKKSQKANYKYPRLWANVLRHVYLICSKNPYYSHMTIPDTYFKKNHKFDIEKFCKEIYELQPKMVKKYEKDPNLVIDKDKLNQDGANLFTPERISFITQLENHKWHTR